MRLSIVFLASAMICTAVPSPADPWELLRVFEGKWAGLATGKPGKGVSHREYRFELAGRFLLGRNKSEYEPKSSSDKPEIHEDVSWFSYDRSLKKIVLRQFHIEGFVNEYTSDWTKRDGKQLEFITTRIENIAPGWRAKEAYQVVSQDEMVEIFSLAAPGKEFEVYTTTRLKRVK